MIGPIVSRAAATFLGLLLPAFQCFKDIEGDAPTMRDWCIYWVVLILYTAIEKYLDMFLSWLPLFQEAKIAFIYFLAHAGGAAYMYDSLVQPLLLEHEAAIDGILYRARTWVQANRSAHLEWAWQIVQKRLQDITCLVYNKDTKQEETVSPRIPAQPLDPGSVERPLTAISRRARKRLAK